MLAKCPCGLNKAAQDCCHLIIAGVVNAATPEQLMRSRYTAYTKANINHIQKTMAGPAAKKFDPKAAKIWAKSVTWLGLVVKRAYLDTLNPDKGFVEFVATFKNSAGTIQEICELSEFHKINQHWFYTNGIALANSPDHNR